MSDNTKLLEKEIEGIEPSTAKVDMLNRLAFLYFETNPVATLETAQQALLLAQQIHYPAGQAQALLYAGMSESGQRKYEEAKQYYEQCKVIREELKDEEGLAVVHTKLGNTKLYAGNYVEALDHYQFAIQTRERLNDETAAADLYTNSGIIYGFQGNHLKALQSHLKALRTYEISNDLSRIASSCNNIGLIYQEQRNFEEALKMFERALYIRKDKGDIKSMSDLLNNIGMVNENQGKYHEALDYYQQAQRLREKIGDKAKLASSYSNIGNVFKGLGQLDIALGYHETAHKLFTEVNEKRGVVASYVSFGEIYLARREFDKAKDFLEKAVKASIELGLKNHLREALQFLSTVYAVDRNFEKAYECYVEYTAVDKEISNTETSKQIAQMNLRHEMEQREREAEQEKIRHQELKKSFALLDEEKKRSEELLHNILPEEVAEEIKRTGKSEARYYESVTVMFCDIIGFTTISEQISPQQLISSIDFCYRRFDEIIEAHGLEKIKVIGDAYLCAGGIPVANNTHALDMIRAAFEMLNFTLAYSEDQKKKGLPEFHFRFGINTGPLITGIVGLKKFTYDIWGDTVNVAARMEQNSEKDKINVSGSTYLLVKDSFKCTHRGKISAKNKGEIDMYYVTS